MESAFVRIDFDVLVEVLIVIIVLAFLIERALSILFEYRRFVNPLSDLGLKEPIAFVVSFLVVRYWSFDALSAIFQSERASVWGFLITAAIIAGGSKASIKLFHDLLKVRSSAEEARQARKAPAVQS